MIKNKDISDAFPDINRDILARKIETTLRLNSPTFYETRFSNAFFKIDRSNVTNSESSIMILRITISPYDVMQGSVMMQLSDVTEIFDLKNSLYEEKEKVSLLENRLAVSHQSITCNNMFKVDALENIIDIDANLCKIFNYDEKQLLTQSFYHLFKPLQRAILQQELHAALSQNRSWYGPILCSKSDESSFWMHLTLIPFYHESSYLGAIFILNEIEDAQELHNLSLLNPITHLPSVRKLEDFIFYTPQNMRKKDIPFSFLMLKLNTDDQDESFTSVIEFTKKLALFLRQDDLCIHLESHTLIVIFKNMALQEAIHKAEALFAKLGSVHSFTAAVSSLEANDDAKRIVVRLNEMIHETKEGSVVYKR